MGPQMAPVQASWIMDFLREEALQRRDHQRAHEQESLTPQHFDGAVAQLTHSLASNDVSIAQFSQDIARKFESISLRLAALEESDPLKRLIPDAIASSAWANADSKPPSRSHLRAIEQGILELITSDKRRREIFRTMLREVQHASLPDSEAKQSSDG